MALHRVLPGLEHLVIILLFRTDSSLVLNFGELCGTFLVHAVLEIATHSAVTLTHLAKNIGLVRLLVERIRQGLLLVRSVLSINFLVDLSLFVVPEPVSLLLELLLEEDIGFTVLVNILH